jgi:4-alpha-glucanotransferase
VTAYKAELLRKAFQNIFGKVRREFASFCSQEAHWLDDFSLFMSLRARFGEETPWNEWPANLAERNPESLESWVRLLRGPIKEHRFYQFLFFRQWTSLRRYARKAGVQLIGDIPLYVSHDSADVWAHQELFILDAKGLPRLVAGVPPDYFSATGQVWNNPLFDWQCHRKTGYRWWIQRLRANLERFDLIRLDHFRGFQAGWGIPFGADTAEKGRWIRGPGKRLFEAAGRSLGEMSLIAEDLGFITPPVKRLRRGLGYEGMDVLQLSLGSMSSDSAALAFRPNRILYTGTHDNDTSAGWYRSQPEPLRRRVDRILGEEEPDISWRMMRYAYASAASLVIVPLQDVLALGAEARMNIPGTHRDNWQWRASRGCLTPGLAIGLTDLARRFDRTGRSRV